MQIYNIKDKQKYIKEVAELTQREWGSITSSQEDFKNKVIKKISKIIKNLENKNYCKLILLDNKNLVGFISIFPTDGEERTDLSPWYSTMFIKEEYRGNGYSIILNNAVLREAKKRGYKRIYLKTNLINYYEKFGAHYLETLNSGEKLYYFEI